MEDNSVMGEHWHGEHDHDHSQVGAAAPASEYRSPHAAHDHTHGVVDPSLFSTERGIWALKWSLAGLLATAALQVVVVVFTGSVALLDRKSTRLNSSHQLISYAVFCLK